MFQLELEHVELRFHFCRIRSFGFYDLFYLWSSVFFFVLFIVVPVILCRTEIQFLWSRTRLSELLLDFLSHAVFVLCGLLLIFFYFFFWAFDWWVLPFRICLLFLLIYTIFSFGSVSNLIMQDWNIVAMQLETDE